ncbi:hypothetical protein EV13_1038 [Prochlorococcus sp. MIT 0702]|nr:hypothetical protein EV12_1077 [Prochlorococcus sp. MIT 0701]KGG29571.1 hypothetical protein EV13_1038 [Prochlorococcus sp. MIT 0702]KGG36067.1 hypothetical protein EV14_0474 [Prochlorococcus sp. MIT 0703]
MKSLPASQELLKLEALARKQGSGIEINSLNGLWKFVSVWKQGKEKEDLFSSFMLRFISASLELRQDKGSHESMPLVIVNSVVIGLLKLEFIGRGELKGSQPLLPFFFDQIKVSFASRVLWSRPLDEPEEKERPFFALISMGANGEWLAARGRGGGLALWLKG